MRGFVCKEAGIARAIGTGSTPLSDAADCTDSEDTLLKPISCGLRCAATKAITVNTAKAPNPGTRLEPGYLRRPSRIFEIRCAVCFSRLTAACTSARDW